VDPIGNPVTLTADFGASDAGGVFSMDIGMSFQSTFSGLMMVGGGPIGVTATFEDYITIFGGTGSGTGVYWPAASPGIDCDFNIQSICSVSAVGGQNGVLTFPFTYGVPVAVTTTALIELLDLSTHYLSEEFSEYPAIFVLPDQSGSVPNYSVQFSPTQPIPELGTMKLSIAGLLLLLCRRRSRNGR
jgi:hypothetical protein